jgi:recombination protein RecA
MSIDKALLDIKKKYGEGTIFKFGDKPLNIQRFSSGSLGLDIAIGGGIPRGRIIVVSGPPSSGKSSLCQHAIAEIQKLGEHAAYIDVEHALDPTYMAATGVNLETLYISQPNSAQQAWEVVEILVKSNAVSLVCLDSLAALVTDQEIEGDMGESHVGLTARLNGQAMRKINGILRDNNCTLLLVNQLRHNIGGYGNPEVEPGGEAPKFFASVKLDVRRIQTLKDGKEATANRTKIKVTKNKTAPPLKECEIDLIYGKGFYRSGELVDLGCDFGIIDKRGSWLSYESHKLQGRDNMASLLESDLNLAKEIEDKIRKAAGL